MEAEHFYRPAHAALFASITNLAAEKPAPNADAPASETHGWVIEAVTRGARETPTLTLAYAHHMASACPHAGHLTTYARMVLAAHTRRTLASHAARLLHLAHTALTEDADPQPTHDQADFIANLLPAMARRWNPHPGSLPRRPELTDIVQPQNPERREREAAFLAAATTQPSALSQLREVFKAEDFSKLGLMHALVTGSIMQLEGPVSL